MEDPNCSLFQNPTNNVVQSSTCSHHGWCDVRQRTVRRVSCIGCSEMLHPLVTVSWISLARRVAFPQWTPGAGQFEMERKCDRIYRICEIPGILGFLQFVAGMHNRMLNTRCGTRSANASEISPYSLEPSLVVEHTRYNPSRSRRQLNQPAATRERRKDPAKKLFAGDCRCHTRRPRKTARRLQVSCSEPNWAMPALPTWNRFSTIPTVPLEPSPLVRIVKFTGTPKAIVRGESARLSYRLENAERASIEPSIGEIGPSGGELSVSPTEHTTYTLTAFGRDGATQQQEVMINVRLQQRTEPTDPWG